MRKRVVGEEFVANSLEKNKGYFTRPLLQFATISLPIPFAPPLPFPSTFWGMGFG
jgi:hypothetical protein